MVVFHVSSRKSTAGRQCVDRTIARCAYGCWLMDWMAGWLVSCAAERRSRRALGKGANGIAEASASGTLRVAVAFR